MGFFDLFKKKIKCIYVNGTVTVTLLNKQQLIFTNQSTKDFEILQELCKDGFDANLEAAYQAWLNYISEKNNKTLSEVIQIKQQKKKAEIVKQEEIKTEIQLSKVNEERFKLLTATGEFIETDNQLFLGEIPLSIPSLLVTKLVTTYSLSTQGDKDAGLEFESLKNFWRWCSLNPNPESRENLFNYIVNHGLKVNKYGFFVTYRRVNKKKVTTKTVSTSAPVEKIDTDLSEFVSNAYTKIKGQKKSTKNFYVYEQNEKIKYYLRKDNELEDCKGNLFQLYQDFFNKDTTEVISTKTIKVQHYTDAHTGKEDIQIGVERAMDPKLCDWNNHNACSTGYHTCSTEGYGCGNTQIMVLINPMKVVSVPYSDGSKMRVWAYFPVCTLNDKEFLTLHNNIDAYSLGDDYYEGCLKEMEELLKTNTPKELVSHKIIGNLSQEALDYIKKTTTDASTIIKSRVIKA